MVNSSLECTDRVIVGDEAFEVNGEVWLLLQSITIDGVNNFYDKSASLLINL